MSDGLDLTVILPVYHGGRFLQEALFSLRGMDFPADRFEVLVSASGEDQSARAIVEAEAAAAAFRISYIASAGRNRAAQLNAACAAACGKVLAFSDDDCIFPRDWLRQVRAACEREHDLGMLGGTDEAASNGRALNRAMEWTLRSFWLAVGSRRGKGPGRGSYYPHLWNMAMPREVALAVADQSCQGRLSVFNEHFDVHEDLELARRVERAGRRLVLAPQVRVFHYRDTAFFDLLRRNFLMAGTARALGAQRLPHVLLVGALVSVLCLAGLAVAFSPARTLLVGCVALYAALVSGSGVSAAVRVGDARMLALVPAVVMGLHAARALGYLVARRPPSGRPVSA